MPHYFDTNPVGRHRRRQVDVVCGGRTLHLTTDAGVFAAEHLDPGTRELLAAAADPAPAGHLLDLGCGYGAIALSLAVRSPTATVWAVDVNARARELTAGNAVDADLPNVIVRAPEEVPPDVRFTTIWSNPPIRIGKAALHDLLRSWLGRLAPAGKATLVVARNLGADTLQRWLVDAGWPTTRLASRRGFRVFESHAPARDERRGWDPIGGRHGFDRTAEDE